MKLEFEEVFQSGLGAIKTKLKLKEGSTPKCHKARRVPYLIRPKIAAELQKLENEGINTKVDWSILTTRNGRGVKEVSYHQHAQRSVSIQQTVVWRHICTCNLSKNGRPDITDYSRNTNDLGWHHNHGETDQEHLENVQQVLERLRDYNMRTWNNKMWVLQGINHILRTQNWQTRIP